MQAVKHVVKLPSGNYVKEWQYSQGNLDFSETNDVFAAADISEGHFNTFFKDEGELLRVAVSAIISPVSREARLKEIDSVDNKLLENITRMENNANKQSKPR